MSQRTKDGREGLAMDDSGDIRQLLSQTLTAALGPGEEGANGQPTQNRLLYNLSSTIDEYKYTRNVPFGVCWQGGPDGPLRTEMTLGEASFPSNQIAVGMRGWSVKGGDPQKNRNSFGGSGVQTSPTLGGGGSNGMAERLTETGG